jgi:mannitol/fructose-specific phosphotransferase system IIA component (Ntr-type)
MPSELTIVPVSQTTLADYTRPELVVPALHERDTAGIISELSRLLQRQGSVADLLPFYHVALNQELLANSAHSCGIALPHARLSGVKQLCFAFGRTTRPVVWGSKNSCAVQLIFLLAVPATDAANYLHLLATLARLAHKPERLEALRTARDVQAITQVLEEIKLRP